MKGQSSDGHHKVYSEKIRKRKKSKQKINQTHSHTNYWGTGKEQQRKTFLAVQTQNISNHTGLPPDPSAASDAGGKGTRHREIHPPPVCHCSSEHRALPTQCPASLQSWCAYLMTHERRDSLLEAAPGQERPTWGSRHSSGKRTRGQELLCPTDWNIWGFQW